MCSWDKNRAAGKNWRNQQQMFSMLEVMSNLNNKKLNSFSLFRIVKYLNYVQFSCCILHYRLYCYSYYILCRSLLNNNVSK